MKTTQRTPTSLGLPLVNDVKIECSLCHNQIGASPTNPNLFDGFQDIYFDCFVCNGCKNKYYIAKNMKGNGKLSYSERPVVIETYIAQKAFNSKKKVVKKQKSESTGTNDKNEDENKSAVSPILEVADPNNSKRHYTTIEATELINKLPALADFVENASYPQSLSITLNEIDCKCNSCLDEIQKSDSLGAYSFFIAHADSKEQVYVFCKKCASDFPRYELNSKPKKEVSPILEVAEANNSSYDEKVKTLRKLFINEDVDFLNPEKHRIFPNEYFASFEVKKMPYKCASCNDAFEGNGTYDSAYFVHHAPNHLEVYCSMSCIRNNFEFAHQRLFEFQTQLHGYTNRVLLPNKFNDDRKYKLAWYLVKSWAYEINKFVPNGFSSIKEARDFLRVSELAGSSDAIDGGRVESRFLNMKWWKNGETTIQLKEAQTLKLINEILANSEPQLPVEGQVMFRGTKAYTVDEIIDTYTIVNSNPTSPKEVLQALEDITTPKKELSAAKTINDSYPGGKSASGSFQFLINQIPPVDCIISGFLGHCAVLKKIKPAKMMVGMDIDKKVIDTWSKSEKDIKLINDSFLNQTSFINPVNFGKTLVFLDPPYLMDTRSSQAKIYDYEFSTPEQHEALLNKAIKFPCYVMITAYENELYDRILTEKRGWRKMYFSGQTRQGRVKETLYLNFPEPEELHDYSFFGSDYRDRHNNKKKIARQIKELEGMPPARRNFILNQVITHFRNK